MPWLRIDDGFSRHPKVTALNHRERWTWIDLLCYCARYQTAGYLPENIREHVAGATDKYLANCGALGLLDDVDGELRVHDWETYAPKDPTGADRQANWRRRKRNDGVTEPVTAGVTENVTTESSTSRAGTARVPVPSRPQDHLRDETASPLGSKEEAPTRDAAPLEGTITNELLLARLAATAGGRQARDKIDRTLHGYTITEADLVAAQTAATGPGVNDRLAVTLAELTKRRRAA